MHGDVTARFTGQLLFDAIHDVVRHEGLTVIFANVPVGIEAGHIGFGHLLRGKVSIRGRDATGQQRIAGERGDRRDGVTTVSHPYYAAAARAVTGKYFSSQS